MEITLTTPTLLFSAVALMSLAYSNRYASAASRIRALKLDYDNGHKHPNIEDQVRILIKRINAIKVMHALDIVALIFAAISMFLIYANWQVAGKAVFGLALILFICSLIVSFYDITLSNKALVFEVKDLLKKNKITP